MSNKIDANSAKEIQRIGDENFDQEIKILDKVINMRPAAPTDYGLTKRDGVDWLKTMDMRGRLIQTQTNVVRCMAKAKAGDLVQEATSDSLESQEEAMKLFRDAMKDVGEKTGH